MLAVLVRINTPEARQLVETLAKGTSDALLTPEAREALKRFPAG